MARRLRLQYPRARYHVINRGNLQHDIFLTNGAKRSFLTTLGEAAAQFCWRAGAFVIMRNHYHLALETPEPNLVAGMHWLQSIFAIRLTRFHRQHGRFFRADTRLCSSKTSTRSHAFVIIFISIPCVLGSSQPSSRGISLEQPLAVAPGIPARLAALA